VAAQRGKVSFVRKYINMMESLTATKAQASALLLIQPGNYKWPFMPADSSNELSSVQFKRNRKMNESSSNTIVATSDTAVTSDDFETLLPVLMIREQDFLLLQQYLREEHEHMSPTASFSDIQIRFGEVTNDCVVCQERILCGEDILKLPCHHLYHHACVRQWLLQKSSCPLCRSRLPKSKQQTAEKEAALQFTENMYL
jgi:hypothetical protein